MTMFPRYFTGPTRRSDGPDCDAGTAPAELAVVLPVLAAATLLGVLPVVVGVATQVFAGWS